KADAEIVWLLVDAQNAAHHARRDEPLKQHHHERRLACGWRTHDDHARWNRKPAAARRIERGEAGRHAQNGPLVLPSIEDRHHRLRHARGASLVRRTRNRTFESNYLHGLLRVSVGAAVAHAPAIECVPWILRSRYPASRLSSRTRMPIAVPTTWS